MEPCPRPRAQRGPAVWSREQHAESCRDIIPVLPPPAEASRGSWGAAGPHTPRGASQHWYQQDSPGHVLCACVEQPGPGPTPPALQTHRFPLPFPPNQPAESFINLRKRESKQKEPEAEPKRDLSNLPSLSSPGPRYYLSAFAESPPSGPHQTLPEAQGLAAARTPDACVISAASSSASPTGGAMPAGAGSTGGCVGGGHPSALWGCQQDTRTRAQSPHCASRRGHGDSVGPNAMLPAWPEKAASPSRAGAGRRRSAIWCLKY